MSPTVLSWLRRALALALLPLAALAPRAFAQDGGYVNPPGRVAQLNYFEGTVSFEPAGYGQWAAAVLNRPLTQGDRVWNAAGARSELHVGSTTMQLSGQTSLAFTTLDDQTVQLALTQGSAIARVRELPAGQRFEIDTPNLALTALQPGTYRVDVDPGAGTTTVTVRAGSVQVSANAAAPLTIPAVEQIVFSGTGLTQLAAQASPLDDAFGYWAAARDAAEDRATAARYLPRDMVGWQQLDDHGSWETDPTYGEVWVPTVTVANWAPYRYGHWAYILPWGWTWIDDEPWGFAPFHYGRWAMLGPRWCWVPGPITVRPVYAPALVAFVGGSVGGVNFSISIGGQPQPAVGWFPLAPGEVWHPPFRASPTYVNEVNRTVIVNRNVTNITNIVNVNRVTKVYRFQDSPQAVTAVSERTFSRGGHLRGSTEPVSEQQLARARVMPAPAPTRDPRAIFAASRVTQPHPAPPPAAIERRVIANPPATAREREPGPMRYRAMPAQPRSATAPAAAGAIGPQRSDEAATEPRRPPEPAGNAARRAPRPPAAVRTEPAPRMPSPPRPLPPHEEARVRQPGMAPLPSARERPQPPPREEALRNAGPQPGPPSGPAATRPREQRQPPREEARAGARAEPRHPEARPERPQRRDHEDRGRKQP